ncbi:MAG: DJ-1/PfpI family protein, partial [Paramuribaculum sp.]|nr:DJ-1/PfpI family protein [Paramuribaculum sp.]
MKHSFIFLAPGFEEIEALATVDVLRRAEMTVTTVAVTAGSKTVEGAHGVKVEADIHINDADLANAEWLICPGGMPGAANLAANKKVSAALTDQFKKGGKIAAICASPAIVLEPLGILAGREATCYPGMEGYI